MKDVLRLLIRDCEVGVSYELSDSQHKHLKVLRLESGDSCEVFDGKGNLYKASLNVSKKISSALIESLSRTEPLSNHLTIAVAPTKNMSRFEWFLEKTTELGVQKIIPLRTAHSERTTLKMERVARIIESAASQSKELWLPQVGEMTNFEGIIQSEAERKWIAHCHDGHDMTSIKDAFSGQADQLVLIGPEGDFSKQELNLAMQNGFESLSLGSKRLRTETAALSVVLAYSMFND